MRRLRSIDCFRRDQGFTLVETLIALAVASLVLTLLATVSHQFGLTARVLGIRSQQHDEADSCFRVFRLMLGHIELEAAGGEGQRNLRGQSESVQIHVLGPPILDLAAPADFLLAFEPSLPAVASPATGRILLSWIEPNSSQRRVETVVGDVVHLEIAYKGQVTDAVWRHEWSDPVASLRAVRVDLDLRDGGAIVHHRASFAVTPTLPQRCVIDPLKDGCPTW